MDADHFRDDRKSPLTWQDVKRMVNIADNMMDKSCTEFMKSEEVYFTEVLKRFNEQI